MRNSSTASLVAIQDNTNKQTNKQTNNAGIHAFFKRSEVAVPAFEQYKTIHALDHVARVIGCETTNRLCTSK